MRSPDPPPSLATRTSWGGADVRERLRIDFDGQCYLCEGMLERSWQIEHLRPRAAFPELEHAWSNLYPACAICNQRRMRWGDRGIVVDEVHKPWPADGLLDPTGDDDIAGRLLQWIELGVGIEDTRIHFEPSRDTDPPASNTAEELRHLHNGQREDARQLRGFVHARVTIVFKRIVGLLASQGAEQIRLRAEIQALLGPTAPYSSLLREEVRRLCAQHPALVVALIG